MSTVKRPTTINTFTGDGRLVSTEVIEADVPVETDRADKTNVRLHVAIDTLSSKAAWDALTAAQRSEMTRRVLLGLARLAARRFDQDDA